jgi:hypothetical protein
MIGANKTISNSRKLTHGQMKQPLAVLRKLLITTTATQTIRHAHRAADLIIVVMITELKEREAVESMVDIAQMDLTSGLSFGIY